MMRATGRLWLLAGINVTMVMLPVMGLRGGDGSALAEILHGWMPRWFTRT
jgi:hypothetical protein